MLLWLLLAINVGVWLVHNYLQKYLADRLQPLTVARRMFAVTLALAAAFHLYVHQGITYQPLGLAVAAVGSLNAMAAWFFISGVKINLAKTSLLNPLTTVVAVILGVIFLGEYSLINPATLPGSLLLAGSIVSLAALVCFNYDRSGSDKNDGTESRRWFIMVLLAIILWGITNFLLKAFSLGAMPMSVFLLFWYGGAFIGLHAAATLAAFVKERQSGPLATTTTDEQPTSLRLFILSLGLGFLTILSLGSFYYLLRLGPGVLLFPLHDVATIGGSVAMGLLLFKEKKSFHRFSWIGLALGATGIVFLAVASALQK